MAHALSKHNSCIILALHHALLEPDKSVGRSRDLRVPFGIHLAHDYSADYSAGCFKSGRYQAHVDFDLFKSLSSEERKHYLIAKWNEFPLAVELDGTTLDIAGLELNSSKFGTSSCKYYVFLKPADGKATPFAFVEFDDFRFIEVSFMYFTDINRDTFELESFEIEDVFRLHYVYYKKRQASA